MASSAFEFQVPDDWRIARLGDILLKGPSNGIYKSVEFRGSGISIVDMKGIFANRRIGNADLNQIELTESEKKKFLLKKGDLIFARTSLKPEGVGLCSIVVDNSLPCVYESNVIQIRPNQSIAYPEYLAQFFWSSHGRRQIRRVIRQVAATSITGRNLAAIQVPLPPLNEQKIISTLLSGTDLGIELINEAITHLKKLKKGLMRHLLTKGIGHTKFKKTKIGEIPERWKLLKLSHIAKNRTERYTPKDDEHLPYIGLEHIEPEQAWIDRNGVSSETRSQKTVFRQGEVLFGKLRPYLRKVAAPSFDGVCSTDILVLASMKNITNEYLLLLLSSNRTIQHAIRTSEGTKMPRTSWKSLKQLEFPIPLIDEQERIVSYTSALTGILKLEKKEELELQHLKKGLMQVLLTGELRVKI